ncbi:MAG TPA: hypothetical protein VK846_14120 [Candidatus Limnocylindria bacterium]|nr:hypothetical protein [Candidatus Limnocylindria bacterium]
MTLTRLFLAATLAMSFAGTMARAQETNSYPKSNLELFEAMTSVVIIRGTDEAGVVIGKIGGVTLRCRESRDPGTNRRESGVIVTVTQVEGLEDTTVVDYDELDGLIRGINYISNVDWSVTSLSHFEAGFTTRSGFKVASFSSRRSGTIEAFALSNRLIRSRSALTMAQLAQLRVYLEQAKAKLDVVQKAK